MEFETYGANSTSNGAADFATGRIAGFFQSDAAPTQDIRYYQYSWYINDQWKVNRRLTLTLGLRAEHMGNWVPTGNLGLAVWDPSSYNNSPNAPAWTGLTWHGINSKHPEVRVSLQGFFYEPRLGVAYDLFGTGNTVLRGGFGVFRYQGSGNNVGGTNYNAPLNVYNEVAPPGTAASDTTRLTSSLRRSAPSGLGTISLA